MFGGGGVELSTQLNSLSLPQWDDKVPCLLTSGATLANKTRSRIFHPEENRPVTLLELKLIQGFSRDMIMQNADELLERRKHAGTKAGKRQTNATTSNAAAQKYVAAARMIGNAVCPPVAKAYAAVVFEAIQGDRERLLGELEEVLALI